MNHQGKRILLVEDDTNLGYVVKDNLNLNGLEVTLCEDGSKGLRAFQEEHFDLCILDIMLPKMDGFHLAEAIRKLNDQVPILFLTAKAMKEDRIQGFRLGADDYITKPFSIEELLMRIDVFLRRSTKVAADQTHFDIGAYAFNYLKQSLSGPEDERQLTKREADLLKLFCQNRELILKREEILTHIWGDDDYFNGRSLDVFISKLRKYLKHDPSIEIVNYHSVGFRLEIKE